MSEAEVTESPVIQDVSQELARLRDELAESQKQAVSLRTAKESYKKIALQAVNDLEYMKKISNNTYIERRLEEVRKEIAAVKDQA